MDDKFVLPKPEEIVVYKQEENRPLRTNIILPYIIGPAVLDNRPEKLDKADLS